MSTTADSTLPGESASPRVRWTHLPREARDTMFQLAVIGWTIVPHATHLAGWCVALAAVVLVWRAAIALRNQQQQTNADAEEALNTLFDLVVLERLANMSATQAMAAAARLSDVPVFVHIRGALERARLEQRPPWTDLHRLSRELELPSIADMADVMRLDDQGAALAGVLTARVKELRDAHLTRERVRAHQASEAMTLWMSIPVVVFALAFLIPPLLTMSGAA